MILPPLAFVDVETTGLDPRRDRVVEVGIVTVDAGVVDEWTSLVDPGRMRGACVQRPDAHLRPGGITADALRDAPRFAAIADLLWQRLQGKLFVAHNARFDHRFLAAEFARAGRVLEPAMLCSVMLSRRLYPAHRQHDLDTLIARHCLEPGVRHRALPDARCLWQFWQVLQRDHGRDALEQAITDVQAGPVLPAHLDPALIERLPAASGVFALHAEDGQAVHVGAATNLKTHVTSYFRVDRASASALAVSHRVRDISWRATRGLLGAQLLAVEWKRALGRRRRTSARECYAWRLRPGEQPCTELIALDGEAREDTPAYGPFDSPRKARNVLQGVAQRQGVCFWLLGLRENARGACTQCAETKTGCVGMRAPHRLRHLARAVQALSPLRLPTWPFAGPIGVRERGDLHVFADWRYFGVACSEAQVEALLRAPPVFDADVFRLLARRLPHLPPQRIVRLPASREPVLDEAYG